MGIGGFIIAMIIILLIFAWMCRQNAIENDEIIPKHNGENLDASQPSPLNIAFNFLFTRLQSNGPQHIEYVPFWSGVVLFAIALFGLPYSLFGVLSAYYDLLRIATFGISSFGCFVAIRTGRKIWVWVMVCVAIVFNPFAPLHMAHVSWDILDMAAAVIFLFATGFFEVQGHDGSLLFRGLSLTFQDATKFQFPRDFGFQGAPADLQQMPKAEIVSHMDRFTEKLMNGELDKPIQLITQAEDGDTEAMLSLGALFCDRLATDDAKPDDRIYAFVWFSIAFSCGRTEAEGRMKEVWAKLSSVEIEYAQSLVGQHLPAILDKSMRKRFGAPRG